MKSTTSPFGRDVAAMGHPLKITELIAALPGTQYVTRQAVYKPAAVRKAKKAIRKGFELQKENNGTCFIEIVANCPSNWKMTPLESNKWLEENMLPFYQLGDIKTPNGRK
jgi:2-oxoglutarate ferredoxin oxidoreductase subunit beta